jgi:hypothetical protein
VNAPQPDITAPYLQMLQVLDERTIQLHYSEAMLPNSLLTPVIEPSLGDAHVYLDSTFLKVVCITFEKPMGDEVIYSFRFPLLPTDLAGNSSEPYFPQQFGLIQNVEDGDVVFNEILFNPVSGKNDFVELINRSSKIVALNGIFLSRMVNDQPEKLFPVTTDRIPMMPGDLWTITSNRADYLDCAINPWWLVQAGLPSMPDDKGDIALCRTNGQVLDRLQYNENWHFPLLRLRDGVSLERIDANGHTQIKGNWHSASEVAGFCTPTGTNSQQKMSGDHSSSGIHLSADIFTPNGDGIDDHLLIQWPDLALGAALTLRIFDSNGRIVKTIANNSLSGKGDVFKWDGTNDSDALAPPGAYIVWGRYFVPQGAVVENKKICVLSLPGH